MSGNLHGICQGSGGLGKKKPEAKAPPDLSRKGFGCQVEQAPVELYGRDTTGAESLAAGFSDDVLPSPRVSWWEQAEKGTHAAYQMLTPKAKVDGLLLFPEIREGIDS